MYLEIFLADFAVFRVFLGISQDFADPRPRELSEALYIQENCKTSLKVIDKIISVHSCQVASSCCPEQLTKIS